MTDARCTEALDRLREAVRREGGEWTTGRVAGVLGGWPHRRRAHELLAALAEEHVLAQHPERTFVWIPTTQPTDERPAPDDRPGEPPAPPHGAPRMIVMTARTTGDPDHTGHIRVDVFAGPDRQHLHLIGGLRMFPEDATELIARLEAPERDVCERITPEIAAHVLHHRGDLAGRRPEDEFTRQLIATLTAAPPEELIALAALYPGYVAAVRLAGGLEGTVQILRQIAADSLPAPRAERRQEDEGEETAALDAVALADAAGGA
ncbi:hypothetical protein ACFFMN_33755 [Planobispora siamensis]|uniref:Uncharacterized protein n=1 Tax=Planobispora siamensis TaxID=936338 RepID=A0A8J3WJS7_9ACTN|nr:hypothetical protein [Planobispora siamensis]GIH91983.1 hypothetical protein Psi01_26130 [Planobispora siamensis]